MDGVVFDSRYGILLTAECTGLIGTSITPYGVEVAGEAPSAIAFAAVLKERRNGLTILMVVMDVNRSHKQQLWNSKVTQSY